MRARLARYWGGVALALVALAILVGGLTFLTRSTGSRPLEIALPTAIPPQPWQVFISGAVSHPGIYPLGGDVDLEAALRAAGGPAQDADLPRLQLHVPQRGEASSSLPPYPPEKARLNINTASARELEALPGIGPVLAGRIVAYREEHGPFQRIEDIVDVAGIGPATFQKLKDSITVGP